MVLAKLKSSYIKSVYYTFCDDYYVNADETWINGDWFYRTEYGVLGDGEKKGCKKVSTRQSYKMGNYPV